MEFKKYFFKLYPIILYILKVHLLALATFAIIRIFLLLSNLQNLEKTETSYIIDAFTLGFFIDNIVASVTSFFPIVFSGIICFFTNTSKKVFQYGYNIYYIIAYSLFFGFSIADIPYFNYFYKHIDSSILDWLKFDGEGYGMVLKESSYYKYYLLFFVIIISFSYCIIYFSKAWNKYPTYEIKFNRATVLKYASIFFILATLCFWGIRRKHGLMKPITGWTTYLSPSSFANALSFNTTYNYAISLTAPEYKDKELDFAPPLDKSFNLLKKDFSNRIFNENVSPVSGIVKTTGEKIRANLIIVLMESMSSYYLLVNYRVFLPIF